MASMSDIAFLLLIFFIVSTSFLVCKTLNVELPAYSAERSKGEKRHVKVFLAGDSMRAQYGEESRTLEMFDLESYIVGALASAEDVSEKVVLLEIHDDCPYQRVVTAFDAIRAAGGYVSLVEPGTQ